MNVLELYSGVGGMHMAFLESKIPGKIVAAIDINTVANSVYKHNFPDILLLNRNIQSLTASYINSLNIDVILMSPPCQPFTRNGLKGDNLDPRTCSFIHLLNILPELIHVKYILIENVKGFETSIVHDKLIDTLEKCQFTFQEFILSPNQIGVPNTRHRYYCLAKKNPLKFCFVEHNSIMESLPSIVFDGNKKSFLISEVLENVNTIEFNIPDNILKKRAMILDICTLNSDRSCCFTKAYGRYVEGTGSVLTPKSKEEITEVYKKLETLTPNDEKYLEYIKTLKLRFFTPCEVAKLMCYPKHFTFPLELSNIQKYRLLGNSINVLLVSKLVQLLIN